MPLEQPTITRHIKLMSIEGHSLLSTFQNSFQKTCLVTADFRQTLLFSRGSSYKQFADIRTGEQSWVLFKAQKEENPMEFVKRKRQARQQIHERFWALLKSVLIYVA